jgi:hypothetical protein
VRVPAAGLPCLWAAGSTASSDNRQMSDWRLFFISRPGCVPQLGQMGVEVLWTDKEPAPDAHRAGLVHQL